MSDDTQAPVGRARAGALGAGPVAAAIAACTPLVEHARQTIRTAARGAALGAARELGRVASRAALLDDAESIFDAVFDAAAAVAGPPAVSAARMAASTFRHGNDRAITEAARRAASAAVGTAANADEGRACVALAVVTARAHAFDQTVAAIQELVAEARYEASFTTSFAYLGVYRFAVRNRRPEGGPPPHSFDPAARVRVVAWEAARRGRYASFRAGCCAAECRVAGFDAAFSALIKFEERARARRNAMN